MGLKEIIARIKIKSVLRDYQGMTFAEKLAEKSYTEVKLFWNGSKELFKIREISFMELMTCGKFPNLFLSYGRSFVKGEDDKPVSEDEAKKVKTEQLEFMHELAKKSMVRPTYKECFEAIKKNIPDYEDGDTVIPNDFLNDLYLWYMKGFAEMLKKNLSGLNLKELEERQNIGEKPRQTI